MILGDIVFRDFEVPPAIRFGASQRVAIHRLSGGGRVVDTLGRDDADIEFSGILSGSDAVERASLISTLSDTGKKTSLAWDAYFFEVVVKEFKAEYKSNRWIPYDLTCIICQADTNPRAGSLAATADGVAADIRQAAALFPSGRAAYTKIQTDLNSGTVPGRDSNSYLAVLADLAALDEQITAGLMVVEQEGVAPESARNDVTSPSASGVQLMVEAARAIAFLTTAQAYTRRAAMRLRNERK